MEQTKSNQTSEVDRPPDRTTNKCPECGGTVIQDEISRICNECGLVVEEDAIDHGPEWRDFEAGSTAKRAGSPVDLTREDNGFDTQIGNKSGPMSDRQRRLLRASEFSHRRDDDKKIEQAKYLGDIKRAVSVLEIPDPIGEMACVLFKQTHNAVDHTGHDLNLTCAASILAAARCNEAVVFPVEICTAFDIEEKSEVYNELKRVQDVVDLPIPLRRPRHYISEYMSELDGAERTKTLAQRLAVAAEEKGTYNGSSPVPSAVAGGIIHAAMKKATWEETPLQKRVADVVGVNTTVIKKHREKVMKADLDVRTNDLSVK